MSDVLIVLASALGWCIKISGCLLFAMGALTILWVALIELGTLAKGLNMGQYTYLVGRCALCGMMKSTRGSRLIRDPDKQRNPEGRILEVFCCRDCREAEAFKAAVK